MFTRIDHVVILVPELDHAIETYRGLGFQVVPGGVHPGGTHNALIAFRDGSYLELIAFQQPEQPSEHRWHRFLAGGGGLVDFALGVDDLAAELERIRARGLDYRGPVPGARRRPDGVEVAWRLGQPLDERTGELPFLIDDVTPRPVRVPGGPQAEQPNGVVGVRGVVVARRDPGVGAGEWGRLLGETPPAAATDESLVASTVTFDVGSQQVVIASPLDPGSPLAGRIQRRGDGPFELVLLADGREAPLRYRPEDAEGARIRIEPVR